jgi:hypothetical protein
MSLMELYRELKLVDVTSRIINIMYHKSSDTLGEALDVFFFNLFLRG